MGEAVRLLKYKPLTEEQQENAKQVPEPKGWTMLVAPLEIEDETEGGIAIPIERVEKENYATVICQVIKQGPLVYRLKKFDPGDETDPGSDSWKWCREGDYVLLASSYGGQRIKVHGMEFRIINDDQITSTVEDPRGLERAY